jgi:cell division protein FtsB
MSLIIVALFSLFWFVIFSDNGLADLKALQKERDSLVEKNEKLTRENLSLYREIDRLKNDPEYIENVARKELGFVGKGEIVFKIEKQNKEDEK